MTIFQINIYNDESGTVIYRSKMTHGKNRKNFNAYTAEEFIVAITKNLVSQSLFRAVAAKRPGKGLIHHSNRGSQYCAQDYRKLLDQFGMTASMSRKGNCYDNAPMESFWGTLKQELVHHRRYRTREEAIQEITEYIEIFYNRQRRQARLGYLYILIKRIPRCSASGYNGV